MDNRVYFMLNFGFRRRFSVILSGIFCFFLFSGISGGISCGDEPAVKKSEEKSESAAEPTMKRMIETYRALRDRFLKEGKENAVRVLEEKIAAAERLDEVISLQFELNQHKKEILARIRELEPAVNERNPEAALEMWDMEEALAKVNLGLLDARQESRDLLEKLQNLSLEEALKKDKEAEKNPR